MKKSWIYRRKGVKGGWAGWYEGGKKKAKALPSKALARHFCQIKYTQLNSDVFTGVVNATWQQMVEAYRKAKQVEGLRDVSIYETMLTLGHFQRLIGPDSSKHINQHAIDKFVLGRGGEVQKTTLNRISGTSVHFSAGPRRIGLLHQVWKSRKSRWPRSQ